MRAQCAFGDTVCWRRWRRAHGSRAGNGTVAALYAHTDAVTNIYPYTDADRDIHAHTDAVSSTYADTDGNASADVG